MNQRIVKGLETLQTYSQGFSFVCPAQQDIEIILLLELWPV
jgi:hypothetical protein